MSEPQIQRTKRDRAALKLEAATSRHWRALGWVVLVLSVCAVWLLVPLWTPLLLAAWFAHVAWPIYQWVYKRVRQRERAAAVLTVSIATLALAPLVIATLSLSASAIELWRKLLESESGSEALKALAANGNGPPVELSQLELQQWFDWPANTAFKHGAPQTPCSQ